MKYVKKDTVIKEISNSVAPDYLAMGYKEVSKAEFTREMARMLKTRIVEEDKE